MAKARRIAAILLTAFVLAAMIFSLFMIVHETGHDCIGDHCPVCAVLALCRDTLKALGDALTGAAVGFAFCCSAASVPMLLRILSNNSTPISLKVKLLN